MCHILEFRKPQKYVFNIITNSGQAKCEILIFKLSVLYVVYNVDSDATGRLLIIYSAFVKYLRKNGN